MEDDEVAPANQANRMAVTTLLFLNNQIIPGTSRHSWENSSSFIVFSVIVSKFLKNQAFKMEAIQLM